MSTSAALATASVTRGRAPRPFPAHAILVLFLVLPLAACAGDDGADTGTIGAGAGSEDDVPGRDAEILWDRWGIPHIRAADGGSLFFAYGWAQARNHGELILRNIGSARGRAAEYWGENHIEDDRWFRMAGLDAWAAEAYDDLDDEIRGHVDAFVEGVTAYLLAHPDGVSDDVRVVLPIDGVDVLAGAGAIGLRFSSARAIAGQWLEARSAGAAARATPPARVARTPSGHRGPAASGLTSAASRLAPAASGLTSARPGLVPAGSELDTTGNGPLDLAGAGVDPPHSNAWAIGPTHSASGNALLLANPHLPWSGNLTWMEAHLTAPGVDVYGAALVGLPTINIGFNADLGWTHTVNTQDTEDLFELEVVELDGEPAYLWAGEPRVFERREVEIRVRTSDGVQTESLELLESIHGPVVARDGDRALALRQVEDVAADLGASLRQWWDMARAADLGQFQEAIAAQAVVGQNIVYADRDGNVAYFYGGATPRRSRSEPGFWRGIVPGDDPELLWTEVHPFAEMPQVVNPASGWVQNANDPPWRSTWPPALEAADYPPYLGPVTLAFRPQRSIRMLRESNPLSLEEMIELKHSTRMELADRVVPELLAAAREHGDDDARRAADLLEAWDHTADADSRGGVLFDAWVAEAFRAAGPGGLFATPWSPDEALTTPDGLADPAAAAAALGTATRRVEADHGDVAAAWGEVHRLRRDDVDLPANGGPGSLGIFRVTGYVELDDGTRLAAGGDSFVAAVEFGEPLRAFALIGYGNASRQGSPHRVDQLQLYSTKRLRPVLFDAAEVDAAVVERERF